MRTGRRTCQGRGRSPVARPVSSLSEREVARLERLSRDLGRPKAEIIREAIASYEPEPPDRDFRMAGAGQGPGDAVADYSEEELLEGFGES